MSVHMSRRQFTAGSIATILGGAVLPVPLPVLAAQDGVDLASGGLPTLDISVTESAFEGVPAETASGRYLVNASIPEGVEFASVAFMRPPEGMSAQDLLDTLAGMGPGGGGEASPEADASMAEASPVAEEGPPGADILPLFIYKITFAGGASGPGGMTAQSVIDLSPGEWIAWADDPTAPQSPVVFTVTDVMQTDIPEPEADITVTFIDFAISVEGNLTAGDHIMLVQNHGAQPHFLVLFKGPDSMTNEGLAQVLEGFFSGEMTPEAMPFNPDELQDVMSTVTQSIDTRQWTTVSLEAGTYGGACFFPTAGEGLPHVVHGMHTVFTVE